MQLSLRIKLLTGAAAMVGAYVLLGTGDPEPVAAKERVRNHTERSAPSASGIRRSFATLEKRVVAATAAEALFAPHSWYVAPPPPPTAALEAAKEAVPAKPVAPPLPYAYMGSYAQDGAGPVFFLTRGDRVYDVHIGDILDGTYSVDAFANGQLTLTYKPLNQQQQLTTGATP